MKIGENPSEKENFTQDRLAGLRPGVVVCVVNKEQKVLLGLKKKYQIWEMPQGGIEEQESLIETIKREVEEELGEEFLPALFIPDKPLVSTDQVFFPEKNLQDKKLSVNGKEVPMTGKKYYFCLVARIKDIEPAKIEYEDFKWVSYKEGKALVDQIPQKGKKRILLNILGILKENKFIK